MKKIKLIIVTSARCAHCAVFKGILEELQRTIVYEKELADVVNIEIDAFVFPERGYPTGLRELVQWYPTLILLPTDAWMKNRIRDAIQRGLVAVFNGKIVGKKALLAEPRVQRTLENIVAWVEEYYSHVYLKNEKKFDFSAPDEDRSLALRNGASSSSKVRFIDRIF